MNDLKAYVDGLFAKYKNTSQIQELRDEVLSNLEARINDKVASGQEYRSAFQEAVNSFGSVDTLIDGNRRVYGNLYKKELLQVGVLYTLIAWILTIPFRFSRSGMLLNSLLILLLMVVGTMYLSSLTRKHGVNEGEVSIINIQKVERISKVAWIVWGVYVAASTLFRAGTQFSSNLWFHRPITVDGPYQLAALLLAFTLPFVTVLVPLYITRACHLITVHEVAE